MNFNRGIWFLDIFKGLRLPLAKLGLMDKAVALIALTAWKSKDGDTLN
jgi:hypothetical protein